MKGKITITLDKVLLEKAKALAEKNGQPLAHLIENYLRLLIRNETRKSEIDRAITKLQGSVKLPETTKWKKELTNSLNQKYKL